MIDLSSFAGTPVAVMGLARSGLAAARALADGGAEIRAWDDSEAARNAAAKARLPLADLALAENWRGVETLVLSPGIPHTFPKPHPAATRAREAGAEIIGDIELLIRSGAPARYVGITGTNGKSTTTALIAHILKQAGRAIEVGGNLGRPVAEFAMLDRDGLYVLELSSYQLELTPSLACDVGLLLNISPDHLDRHGGMAGYVAAKRRIFNAMRRGATAVIGVDDEKSRRIYDDLAKSAGTERIGIDRTHDQLRESALNLEDRADSPGRRIAGGDPTQPGSALGGGEVIPISSQRPVSGGIYVVDGVLRDDFRGKDAEILLLSGIETLPGVHNHQNAAAAYAALVSSPICLNSDLIAAGIRSYPGLAHRQELVAKIDGIKYINDSKATNAEAAARALACYEEIYWIAGGRAKEGGLSVLDPYLPHIRRAFLIGEAAEGIAEELRGRVDITISGDLDRAVRDARAATLADRTSGAVVLLSPACSSFDQYRDFEARGIDFRACVAALPGDSRHVFEHGESV